MRKSQEQAFDENRVETDPRGVSEITILPDGRIYVLGLSQAVLDLLAGVQQSPESCGGASRAADACRVQVREAE